MGKRTIIFYAPVGTNLPVHLLGGGEKGCRRTREILSNVFIILSSVEVTLTLKFHVALAFLSIEWLEYQYLRK